MDINPDQPQLKRILSDLEDKHKYLQDSVDHLENEIEKRELEIRKLLAEKGLELAKENSNCTKRVQTHVVDQHEGRTTTEAHYSSEFAKQVAHLLDEITRTAEEVSSLIKL